MIVDMSIIHAQLIRIRRAAGAETRAWAILVTTEMLLNKLALKDYE